MPSASNRFESMTFDGVIHVGKGMPWIKAAVGPTNADSGGSSNCNALQRDQRSSWQSVCIRKPRAGAWNLALRVWSYVNGSAPSRVTRKG